MRKILTAITALLLVTATACELQPELGLEDGVGDSNDTVYTVGAPSFLLPEVNTVDETPQPQEGGNAPTSMLAFEGVISPAQALTTLSNLSIVEYNDACADTYEREEWKHWSPVDDDPAGTNLNTRHNELRRESLTPVTYSDSMRSVTSGTWDLVYTTGTTNDPKDLDAEHVLPLGNVHARACSAGIEFTADEKEMIANDPLLVFMAEKGENRARGAESWGPSPYGNGWFPSNTAVHCDWIALQVQLLDYYFLPITAQELSIADNVLRSC